MAYQVEYDQFGMPKNQQGGGGGAATTSNPAVGAGATNMPYINPNSPQQFIPLTATASKTPASPANQAAAAPAVQAQPGTQNIANQTLQTMYEQAQKAAQPSPIAGLLTSKTQQYMLDPLMGYDPNEYAKTQMANFDLDRAKAFQAAREQVAPTLQSGVVQQGLLGNMLQTQADRQRLGADLNAQATQMKQQGALSALAEGRSTEKLFSDTAASGVENLVKVRGSTEGELGRAATSAENALNRLNDIMLKTMDNEGQMAVAELQGKIQQGLQLSRQDWESAENALNRNLSTAMQANDLNAVRENLLTQLEFDKWKTESGYQFTAEQNALNRALETSLKTMDVNSQMAIAELKAKADKDLLISGKEFDKALAELQISADKALAEGNWANALEITQLQGEIEAQRQAKEQEFAAREASIDREWRTGERVDEQKFEKIRMQLQYSLDEARANNDVARERQLIDRQAYWELQQQTAAMTHDERMANLNSQLEEARAANDTERQRQLMEFQFGHEMEKLATEQGYDEMKMYAEQKFAEATQNRDITAQKALQTQRLEIESDRWAQEFAFKEMYTNYEAIMGQVEAGTISPEDGIKALESVTGFDVTPQDAYKRAKAAIQEDYDLTRLQFAETAPKEYLNPDGTLNSMGISAFNKYINETYWDSGEKKKALEQNLKVTMPGQVERADTEGDTARRTNSTRSR